MAYPQDLLPTFIDHHIDQGSTNEDMSAQLVNGVLPGPTAAVTATVYRGQPALRAVANTTQTWNFTYLKYRGGYVTTAPLTTSVMTGPMSGCYLCTYNQGGLKVAHIGTAHTPEDPQSIAAKTAWLDFEARVDVTGAKGGSPADYFTRDEIQSVMRPNSPIPQIVGYFAGGLAYAILISKLPTNLNPQGLHLSEVLAVKRMTLQPWASIAAMRRFRVL